MSYIRVIVSIDGWSLDQRLCLDQKVVEEKVWLGNGSQIPMTGLQLSRDCNTATHALNLIFHSQSGVDTQRRLVPMRL